MRIKQSMTKATAEYKIAKARTALLLDQPWFGTLAMRLHMKELKEGDVPKDFPKTMAVDGTSLFYFEDFVHSLTEDELLFVMAHEIMHCACRHMYRMKHRDPREWNIACDLAINQILVDSNIGKMPKEGLIDAKYKDMEAEQIYARLPDTTVFIKQHGDGGCTGSFTSPSNSPGKGEGEGEGEGKGEGDFTPTPMSETDWEVAAEQATNVCKKAGNMPGGVERGVNLSKETCAEFDDALRKFLQNTVPSDFSWSKPNKRYVSSGMYLPGVLKENMPPFAVAIDSSGSTYYEPGLIDLFASKLTAILKEFRPERLDIIYCDTKVQGTESFSPEDDEVNLHIKGGGGTAFSPVFEYIEKHFDEPPVCLIFMTDLDSYDKPKEPEYPTLWVTTEAVRTKGPFGETIKISKYS